MRGNGSDRIEPGRALDRLGDHSGVLEECGHQRGAGERIETAGEIEARLAEPHTLEHLLQRLERARAEIGAAIRNVAAELEPEAPDAAREVGFELAIGFGDVEMIEELDHGPGPGPAARQRAANERPRPELSGGAGKMRRTGRGIEGMRGDPLIKWRFERG